MISENTKQWLNENGFNPDNLNQPAKHEDTPIILASRRGEEAVVSELLAADVDINHRNMDGTNALWAAVVADSFRIADKLIGAGVEIDNQNDNGATALMYAASNNKPEWVQYLLEKGVDTTLESLDDFTALELANTVEILRMLRKAG